MESSLCNKYWFSIGGSHSGEEDGFSSNEPLAVDAIVLVNVGFLFQSVSLVGSVQSATPEVVDSSRKVVFLKVASVKCVGFSWRVRIDWKFPLCPSTENRKWVWWKINHRQQENLPIYHLSIVKRSESGVQADHFLDSQQLLGALLMPKPQKKKTCQWWMLMSNGKLRSPKRNQFPCTQLSVCYSCVVLWCRFPRVRPFILEYCWHNPHRIGFHFSSYAYCISYQAKRKKKQFRVLAISVQMKVLCLSWSHWSQLKVINLFVRYEALDFILIMEEEAFSVYGFGYDVPAASAARLLIVNVTIKLFHMPKSMHLQCVEKVWVPGGNLTPTMSSNVSINNLISANISLYAKTVLCILRIIWHGFGNIRFFYSVQWVYKLFSPHCSNLCGLRWKRTHFYETRFWYLNFIDSWLMGFLFD